MMPMAEGMTVDNSIAVQVLNNKLAGMAVREAQMEAAIQQLLAENNALRDELAVANEAEEEAAEG